ncbi:recombinase family protein [Nocardioides sp. HM23]|uniref:recombinase family protein n=1 Tax=Nocardioides bizhenqiangii TaxID=3095076 RepID=UPI002ACAD79E|nr:recombinase family protein [Nocardioides sp. HM23]MDZ5623340.1 recombinase family protein [Nocardioides sp. HM23]
MSKRAVLYARLSVTQDESVSIDRQLQAGRDYCRAQGWDVVAEHKDDGVSASASAPEHRKGWQEVLAHPRGTYDVALVWKVDRLARRVWDFLNADKALQQRGAAVAAVADPVDMSTSQGRAFATMLAVFAEMEADAIKARVQAARKALIRAGRVPGGAAPFGYMNAPNPDGPGKVLAMDPDTIGYVIEAAARVLRGDSINSVATFLDEVAPRQGRKNSAAYWTITVTKRMLANPVLAGMTLHNPGNTSKERGTGVLRDSDGMPIIREDLAVLSMEEYRTLAERLTVSEPYKAASESYLSGLVWCGDCDRKMYRNAKTVHGKRVRVFQCQGKEGCGQQVTNLEDKVEARFLAEFGDSWFIESHTKPTDYDATEIQNQIIETMNDMQQDDADVMALAERLQSLKELKRNIPEVEYVQHRSTGTTAELWAEDKRAALLGRTKGVRLVKGRVGRKFDETRLSWIPLGESIPTPEGTTFGDVWGTFINEEL